MRFATSIVAPAITGLLAGLAGAAIWTATGWGGGGDGTREYLLANPEVLPEAMEELERRQSASQIEPLRDELESPFPGAVLGNPQGAITLVEFTDYACGYCRQSLDHVDSVIAANPDLRVVVREYPILSASSADAARMALAAAEQGRFDAFHRAMFAQGQVTAETIAAAATQAGIDVARANRAIASGQFDAHLQNNIFLARNLGLTGTPSWVVGDRMLQGAVGPEEMGRAIAEARDS